MRIFSIPLLALCFFSLSSSPAYAAGIEYSSMQKHSANEVLIRTSSFTTDVWSRCSLSSFTCSPSTATADLGALPSATQAILAAWKYALPSGASWLTLSSDFRYIAFFIPATQTRTERTFGVFDTQTKNTYIKKETIGYWDLLSEGISLFSFSPDSKTLLYISDVQNHPTLYRVNLESLSGTSLISSRMFTRAYTVADMTWQDNDTLLYIANRENPYQWSLYSYTLSSWNLKKITDGVSYAVPLTQEGGMFLLAKADARGVRPTLYNPKTGTVSSFGLPSTKPLTTQGVVVSSLTQGLKGVFLLEENKHSDTLLVWLHGGPFRQTSLEYHPYKSYGGYDWILEVARKQNIGVLKLDYPGSAGFGRVYAESLNKDIGIEDAKKTALTISDFAKRNGYTNVYVMGNSYGGYLALKLLIDNPSHYKGAISINGVADWMTLLNALSTSIFNVQFGGAPNESNYALYNRASVYNGIDGLGAQKVVLVHGTKDTTIPFKQSEGLAATLTRINKNVSLVALEGEDHVFKKPESFTTLCKVVLETVGAKNTAECEL